MAHDRSSDEAAEGGAVAARLAEIDARLKAAQAELERAVGERREILDRFEELHAKRAAQEHDIDAA